MEMKITTLAWQMLPVIVSIMISISMRGAHEQKTLIVGKMARKPGKDNLSGVKVNGGINASITPSHRDRIIKSI